jgi:hypothetical protein
MKGKSTISYHPIYSIYRNIFKTIAIYSNVKYSVVVNPSGNAGKARKAVQEWNREISIINIITGRERSHSNKEVTKRIRFPQ